MMKNTTMVKDPVCGMDVETATARGLTEYRGQTYCFSSSKCEENIQIFRVRSNASASLREHQKSGHGCCRLISYQLARASPCRVCFVEQHSIQPASYRSAV